MKAELFKNIRKAIHRGSLNCDKHADGEWFEWHKHKYKIQKFFDSGGNHIGYDIYRKDCNNHLQWDFDIQPSFTVIGGDGQVIHEEND